MSNDKISISKVEIDINGKKLELSTDEAKQLKNILVEFFEDDKSDSAPYYIPYPYHVPYEWPRPTWEYDPWTVRYTYGGTADSGNTLYLNTTGG